MRTKQQRCDGASDESSTSSMLGPPHRRLRGRADSLTGPHRSGSTAGGLGMTSERPTQALRRQAAAAVLGTRVCQLYAPALGAPAPISCRALATFR